MVGTDGNNFGIDPHAASCGGGTIRRMKMFLDEQ